MVENTLSLIEVFEEITSIQSKKIKSLISAAPRCGMLRNLENQRSITYKKCRSVEYRRKKMMRYYDLLSRSMGRYSEITMEEFKDFLIAIKSVLDSLAQEIKIVFFLKSKGNFNLYGFIDGLKRENPEFAISIKNFCEKDKWYKYFLDLRNPETHTGKITPYPFITVTGEKGAYISIQPVFEEIKGEILEPLNEGVPQKYTAKKDGTVQEVGLQLPDNPEEPDFKKQTCKRNIKFTDYHVDLSRKISFLFTEFYKEINNELDKMEKMVSHKKCQKNRCSIKYCNLK